MSNRLDELEDTIDPNKWSQKELLKHLYREFVLLKETITAHEDKKNEEVALIKTNLQMLEEKTENKFSNLEEKLDGRIKALESFRSFQLGLAKAFAIVVTIGGLLIALFEIFIQ